MKLNKNIPGWQYYNHAAVPITAPHEEPNLTPIKDGSIWHIDGKKPFLVRYTTDWDCNYDTGWWYIIKKAPFDMEGLSKNSRKHIREALRKVCVKKIEPEKYIENLYECYHSAFLKYKSADNELPFDAFKQTCLLANDNKIEYWAGFTLDTGLLIGYMTVFPHDCWAEIQTAKFHPNFLNLRVSDALYATVLEHFLNELGLRYVSSGTRSINHVTNTQEYKESHFGYQKSYCRLHVVYRQPLKLIIKLAYPFRTLINILGKYMGSAHHLSALLKMEEIVRKKI